MNVFGEKIDGKAIEIKRNHNYVFIVDADNDADYRKAVQLINESCIAHNMGGIIMSRPMTVIDQERLANLEHQQWLDFIQDVGMKLTKLGHREAFDALNEKYWKGKYVPYEQLSEEDKEKDRVFARRILELK